VAVDVTTTTVLAAAAVAEGDPAVAVAED